MRLSEAGGKATDDSLEDARLLDPNWHEKLTDEQIAAYIRYQFIYLSENAIDWDSPEHARKRTHWDGGKDLYGVRRSNIWAQAVRAVRRYSGLPGMWVHAQFSPAAQLKLTPGTLALPEIRPSSLYAATAPGVYARYVADMPDIITHRFNLAGQTLSMRFKTTANLGLPKADQTLYVLCDETYVTAPPFFRYAFAATAECHEAAHLYLFAAAVDYEVHQTVYDAVIAQTQEHWWLTDDLKAAVIGIRQHWESYYG
jgi:hypothetical protein